MTVKLFFVLLKFDRLYFLFLVGVWRFITPNMFISVIGYYRLNGIRSSVKKIVVACWVAFMAIIFRFGLVPAIHSFYVS